MTLGPSSSSAATVIVGCALTIPVAVGLASGRTTAAAAVAVAPLTVLLGTRVLRRLGLTDRRQLFVEAVFLVLLVSTLVWRTRGTEALNANPLDTAAGLRVVLVSGVFAVCVGVIAVGGFGPRLPWGLRLTVVYIVVSGVAAAGSPRPLQAGYRTFELTVGLLALIAAWSLLGQRAGRVIVDVVFAFLGLLSAVVWVEAIVIPGLAWHAATEGALLRVQLGGVLPHLASNTVGTIGALVAIRGLVISDLRLRWIVTSWGLLTLLASQERTGIVGFALAATVILIMRRGYAVAWLVAAALATIAISGGINTVATTTQTGLERGQNQANLRSLSGRTEYWAAAKPLVEERPWLGWGLNVGSRKVLSNLGSDATSTIHGAWLEAVLGVGIPGAIVLGLALLVTLAQALAVRDPLTTGVMLMLAVRSITGSSVELFRVGFVLFGGVALLVASIRQKRTLTARLVSSHMSPNSARAA